MRFYSMEEGEKREMKKGGGRGKREEGERKRRKKRTEPMNA